MNPISRRGFLRSAGMGALTAASAGVFGRYSTRWLDCNHYDLALPRWTRNGFRVGFISDSHLTDDNAVNVTREGLDYVISQKPDVIVFGGDFVEDTRPISLERISKAFAAVKTCRIPTVAVLGNHDYAPAHAERIWRLAPTLGIKVLRNQPFEVAGVTVFGLDCLTFRKTRPELLEHIAARENVLVVLHEPDGADLLPDFPSLMLAGHSHGGQICFPTGIPVHTPSGARKYVKGFYPELQVPTFVSRGLGETGVKLRLFCRPEASILHLVSEGNV